MPEVGVIITAEDRAGAVLRGIGNAGRTSLDTIRGAAGRASDAFKAFGVATAVLNQALEIGKKAIEVFRMAVAETIAVSLEFRRANDPAAKSIRDMARDLQILRARVGDVMIPLLRGFAEGTNNVTKQITHWIVQNRVLIGTKLADWLADIANLLVTGVAQGFIWVSKAVTGVQEIIALTRGSVEKFYQLWLEGNAAVIGGMGKVIGLINEDMAAAFKGAAQDARDFAAVFAESSEENFRKVDEFAKRQEGWEKSISKFDATARRVIGGTHASMLDMVANSTVGLNKKDEELAAAREERDARAEAIFQRQLSRINRERAAVEANTQLQLDIARKAEEEQQAMLVERGAMVEAISQTVTASILDVNKTAREKFKDLGVMAIGEIVKIATKEITARAATAAAGAASSQAGIPVVGPVLATAAAGAMAAFVAGFLTKFQFGGMVRGGTPNIDSVPALLTPGELVLTQQQTKEFLDQKKQPMAAPANVTIKAQVQNPEEMSDAQIKRWLIRVDRQADRLVRDGMFLNSLARA